MPRIKSIKVKISIKLIYMEFRFLYMRNICHIMNIFIIADEEMSLELMHKLKSRILCNKFLSLLTSDMHIAVIFPEAVLPIFLA